MHCARFGSVSEAAGQDIDVLQSRVVVWKELVINFEEECVLMAIIAKQEDGFRYRRYTEGQTLTVLSI